MQVKNEIDLTRLYDVFNSVIINTDVSDDYFKGKPISKGELIPAGEQSLLSLQTVER